jgi:hypothetical protein
MSDNLQETIRESAKAPTTRVSVRTTLGGVAT